MPINILLFLNNIHLSQIFPKSNLSKKLLRHPRNDDDHLQNLPEQSDCSAICARNCLCFAFILIFLLNI